MNNTKILIGIILFCGLSLNTCSAKPNIGNVLFQ